ncbi:MAG: hypothetical protein WBG37_05820, partial [Desulfobacterales bacterium]
EIFAPSTQKIWATAHLTDAPADTSITARLYFRNEMAQTIQLLNEKTLIADGTRYAAFAFSDTNGFSAGAYQAQFLLNGDEVGFVNFTVAAGKSNASSPDSVQAGLDMDRALIVGVDAYETLMPVEPPIFFSGETVALLMLNVGPFTPGSDGRHWFDMDLKLATEKGDLLYSQQGVLGTAGHGVLPDGRAQSPYAYFDRTRDLPPGKYLATLRIYDKIDTQRRAEVKRPFILKASPEKYTTQTNYRCYRDPLRRFGLLVPNEWSLVPPNDDSTALFVALNPDLDPLAAVKVNVHAVSLNDQQTAAKVVADVRANILSEAKAAGAVIEMDTSFQDNDPHQVANLTAAHMLGYEYTDASGRRVAELKAISCAEDSLNILTLMVEAEIFAKLEGDPNRDWHTTIPKSFLTMALH